MSKTYRVAIVGASGAVGVEMLRVMERRNFPAASLRLLASPRSAGKTLVFRGEELPIEPLTLNSFEGIDIALFSAGGAISRDYAHHAVSSGAVVVDNSSAFRMSPDVPLVVPEINGADVAAHRGIIANPNCTTAITLTALHPLHRAFGVKRLFASSYQAVSGAGARAIQELRNQTEAVAKNQPIVKEIFPHQIAFNVIPQVDAFLDSGYTKEEMKMENEGRRIMHLPGFKASVTCVRVPVYRAHSVALSAEFERPISL
ncbi:MAG: aspartate-semialdehyde dehydrogenase, partial [Terrimicrobiaceae bacterium]